MNDKSESSRGGENCEETARVCGIDARIALDWFGRFGLRDHGENVGEEKKRSNLEEDEN